MFEPVPGFIDENAQNTANLLRTLTYVIFGGQEGVLHSTDWKVTERDTPGSGILVAPGVGPILNRAQGQQWQMYLQASYTATDVPVEPTTSADTNGRSDLVAVQIENPYLVGEPWQIPADPVNGPYVKPVVLPNVPKSTKSVAEVADRFGNLTALALARIDIPGPSTGTITTSVNNMVTDLRKVSNPMTGLGPAPGGVGAEKQWTEGSRCVSGSRLLHTNTSFKQWPAEARWSINIPEWATGVDVLCQWTPKTSGDTWGDARLMIDGATGISTSFDDNVYTGGTGGGARTFIMLSGTYVIPKSSRGKTADIHVECKANVPSGTTLGDLTADENCYVYIACTFKQRPSYV